MRSFVIFIFLIAVISVQTFKDLHFQICRGSGFVLTAHALEMVYELYHGEFKVNGEWCDIVTIDIRLAEKLREHSKDFDGDIEASKRMKPIDSAWKNILPFIPALAWFPVRVTRRSRYRSLRNPFSYPS